MSGRSGTCAKCGSGDVSVRYNGGTHGTYPKRPHRRKDEHLDHICCSCGFEWEGDCLDTKAEADNSGSIQPQKQGP